MPQTAIDLDQTDTLPILDPVAYRNAVLASDRSAAARLEPGLPAELTEARQAVTPAPRVAVRAVEEWVPGPHAGVEELAALVADFETLRAALRAAQQRAAELERAAEPGGQARQLDEQRRESTRALEATRAELDAASRSLADSEAVRAMLEREHAALTQALEERNSRVAVLERELSEARSQRNATRGELAATPPWRAGPDLAPGCEVAIPDGPPIEAGTHAPRDPTTLQSQEWQGGVADVPTGSLDEDLEQATQALRAANVELAALLRAVGEPEPAPDQVDTGAAAAEPAAPGGEQADLAQRLAAREAELAREREGRTSAARVIRWLEESRGQQAARITELETLAAGTAGAQQAQLASLMQALAALKLRYRRLELEHAQGALEWPELQIRRAGRTPAGRAAAGSGDAARDATPESHRAQSGAVLMALDGDTPRMLEVRDLATVGRAADNDLMVEDTTVSRHHAIIVAGEPGAFIEDLDSVNGIAINGRRVRHARLTDGDIVTLGVARFRFSTVAPRLPDA